MGETLNEILFYLFEKTGHDFRGYRESTLQRRIQRRLHATGTLSLATYLDYLKGHCEEERKLLADLTLSVTEFFRDPESWETLAKIVRETPREEWQIWSAGCATGEELYSLAFLMAEKQIPHGTLLGTDLDENSLHHARAAVYLKEKLKSIPQEMIERYFEKVGPKYRVIPQIRTQVAFRAVNLVQGEVKDLFDLISCRNVLIYFSKDLQESVLLKFYQNLKPEGFLWLGKAESLWGKVQDLFDCVDKGAKIFKKLKKGV